MVEGVRCCAPSLHVLLARTTEERLNADRHCASAPKIKNQHDMVKLWSNARTSDTRPINVKSEARPSQLNTRMPMLQEPSTKFIDHIPLSVILNTPMMVMNFHEIPHQPWSSHDIPISYPHQSLLTRWCHCAAPIDSPTIEMDTTQRTMGRENLGGGFAVPHYSGYDHPTFIWGWPSWHMCQHKKI